MGEGAKHGCTGRVITEVKWKEPPIGSFLKDYVSHIKGKSDGYNYGKVIREGANINLNKNT